MRSVCGVSVSFLNRFNICFRLLFCIFVYEKRTTEALFSCGIKLLTCIYLHIVSKEYQSYKLKLNKIAARWPAKAVAQRFCSIPIFWLQKLGFIMIAFSIYPLNIFYQNRFLPLLFFQKMFLPHPK